jgi:hypothetical protein
MLRFLPLLSAGLLAQAYYPGAHDDWERRAAGFDAGRLSEAITWAKTARIEEHTGFAIGA